MNEHRGREWVREKRQNSAKRYKQYINHSLIYLGDTLSPLFRAVSLSIPIERRPYIDWKEEWKRLLLECMHDPSPRSIVGASHHCCSCTHGWVMPSNEALPLHTQKRRQEQLSEGATKDGMIFTDLLRSITQTTYHIMERHHRTKWGR